MYFSEVNLDIHTGIKSKVNLQKSALDAIFSSDSDILYLVDGGYFLSDKFHINYNMKFYSLFLYFFLFRLIVNKQYDIVYLRNPTLGISYLLFPIFLIFSRCFGKKIIIELPTFPFIYEYKLSKKIPLQIFSLINLNLNSLLGNLTFVCSNNKIFWLLKYFKINNYIDHKTPLFRNSHLMLDDCFNIVGISNLNFWHGYEKLIDLILDYRGELKVNFYILTYTNPYSLKLFNFLKQKNINNIFIIFDASQEEMSYYLSKSHICVDSLSRSSNSAYSNFSLKSRYYCSLGVPFISSNKDPIFEDIDFVFDFKEDSTINDIITWFNLIQTSPLAIKNYVNEKLDIITHWKNLLDGFTNT